MSRQQSSEALTDLLVRLFMADRSSMIGKTQYPASIMDFPLRLSSRETISVMPRIGKQTLLRISNGARAGNLDDMLTLSMMYSVGLGVPESTKHAMSWANFSTMNTGPLDFESAIEELEEHLEEAADDFAYPAIVEKIYRSLLPTYSRVTCKALPSGTYLLSPLIAGLRLYAIYRVHKTDDRSYCYLYDLRVGGLDGERLSLDLANKLNIPNYIGSHGPTTEYKRLIHPDYVGHMSDYIEGPAKYFVVGGTLAIPSSMKAHVKRVLPSIKTASDLFDFFLTTAGKERTAIRNCPEYEEIASRIDNAQQRIKRIKKGEEYENLRESFSDMKKEHRRAKRSGDYELAATIKEKSQSVKRLAALIKEGKAIPLLEKKVVKLKQELESVEDQNLEYKVEQYAKYPEHFFDFVASDIYYGDNGEKITPLPLGQHVNKHLSGIGFNVAKVNLFDGYEVLQTKMLSGKGKLAVKTYQKVVEKFERRFSEYKVTGLVARPIELGSVKKPQKLPVYLVTSE